MSTERRVTGLDPTFSTARSEVTAIPTRIRADGNEYSTIAVQLRNAEGLVVPSTDTDVRLETSLGSVSAVGDRGNGLFAAHLTSTVGGTAVISATVNGLPLEQTATVQMMMDGGRTRPVRRR